MRTNRARLSCFLVLLSSYPLNAWVVHLSPAAPAIPPSSVSPASTPTSARLSDGVSSWLLSAASAPQPSAKDILVLNQAFAEYNAGNYERALPLFDDVVERWQGQPADERAALYRTRADVHFQSSDAATAYKDYSSCLQLLLLEDKKSDEDSSSSTSSSSAERPTALLGRARAAKTMGQSALAVGDYRMVLQILGTTDYDDEDTPATEQILNGIDKNPFAAWEYADCLRSERQYTEAGKIREAASLAFRQIGDSGRAVIALTDAGVDYAGDNPEKAITVLQKAVEGTKGVEGRDVKLLQRVISKEGEGRMALAALLWTSSQKNAAETVLGDACLRMDQLLNQMDGTPSLLSNNSATSSKGLRYSMEDDNQLVGSLTCTRFRNKEFLATKLHWPESLQDRVLKLETLR